ncbi:MULTISPECIES: sulfur carrier protein ThiS [Marinobacter]|uniref:Sulfur carrier protein ThiS n=1 Tax=Marinobacter xestospongiae TaxID=994319 RepID=A0ABU3VW69_9GAMM|nr:MULTISPECIES: sulfur carrier protein ThiS [Marinobacter]MCG8518347.1 sulfur carrier protein ThiS [Pseudomonadales bacterium]MCK7566689.1 sulfur carrier protein ThiS [Marinobacter xestospongiae]MDV2078518.1 sulfur carrier protein ThiS [Marinobacter xestospongiae]UDL05644.1 sulfur carrier protein ThiS [Marinobacter sp. CA1]
MNIELNGEAYELADQATVATLLDALALHGKRLAVEVNEDIVPRSQHAEFRLQAGDRVEVVHAIGGG